MNLRCFTKGHTYTKIKEHQLEEDFKEMFYASNWGTSVTYYEYDLYQCDICLKQKRVYTGNRINH